MSTNKLQSIEKAKGRAMLVWAGKKPLESIEYYPAQEKEIYGNKKSQDFNKLFWGDNLQVLAHLLKEYRGKVDLIYIDPPFDSKADYVKSVKMKGEKVEGVEQGLLEEKQYGDIWEKDEYLQFMYERFLILKELLSENGSIYLHCDWHKNSHLRLLMDEVFSEDNFRNEIIWHYFVSGKYPSEFAKDHDNIYVYSKSKNSTFNYEKQVDKYLYYEKFYNKQIVKGKDGKEYYEYNGELRTFEKQVSETWNINKIKRDGKEIVGYPTQKPEELLERIIKASSNEGDVVLDCFCGSGTTMVTAQKLGRRWIGCDINLGAIQTSTKRLNQIIEEQKNALGFKVLNVNEYTAFKNELEAKDIVMEMYGVEPMKRSYFDGVLDTSYVKVMPMNRVLNKLDMKTLLKNVNDKLADFTVKKKSKSGEAVYDEGVLVICSGMDLEVADYLKKENKTGVKIDVRDIATDKKNLVFKKPPEANIEVKVKDKNLSVSLKEFYSPIMMRKLEIENSKALKKEYQAKVEDFRQIIDSVAIDVDYTGDLFNAEIMDLPTKRELIKADYSWGYPKKGKYTVAVKIVDVLGEEYFETFRVNV
ncbi:MAG: modification methylase protein [Parcubacteria group bacterium GW2011_GWF2_38_76]|nr:MAG: modification methylase protein [Parcubacteria group bacterium GW2011_GWF2_38_76]HBM45643.1 site-specific DNA-methyltransferase [Patescibacteria group bacterium]